MGRRNELDASRRGKKWLKYCRDKNAFEGKNRSGEGGGKPLTSIQQCDPGSELRLIGGREKRRANIYNWEEEKSTINTIGTYSYEKKKCNTTSILLSASSTSTWYSSSARGSAVLYDTRYVRTSVLCVVH